MRTLWVIIGTVVAVLVGTVGGFVLYPIDQSLFAGFSLIALSAGVATSTWLSIAALVRASATPKPEEETSQQSQPQRQQAPRTGTQVVRASES